MSYYKQLVIDNKEKISVEVIYSINDATLQSSFSFYTNLHCDFGIVEDSLKAAFFSSKKKARKLFAMYKQSTGRKFVLCKTENSLGFTRLIYTLKLA